MSRYLKLGALSEPQVHVENDPRDKPAHRELCTRAGQLLVADYPYWIWKVEIPPEDSGMIIVRNLTLDPDGKYGYAIRLDRLSSTLNEITYAAGAFLERYEQVKGHSGEFKAEDLDGKIVRLIKPEM